MSNFSHFNNNNSSNNNNNYIPSFYGDMASLSRPQVIENSPHLRSFGAPHNFTFTHPTQVTTIPTPRSSIQVTSSMGFLGAPGLGTTWQHSNPSSITSLGNSGITTPVYTGMPPRLEPQPSCSSPMKRPKRKAKEYAEDAPSSKVYLCTDQFANLHINHDWTQHPNNHQRESIGGFNEIKSHDPGGWNRFHEVENSIDCDGDEEKTRAKERGALRINESFVDNIKSPKSEPILPRNVLNQISQPCMQVVLWKSPGELVRDLVKEDSVSCRLPPPPPPPTPSSSSSPSLSSSPSRFSTSFHKSSKFKSTGIGSGSSAGPFSTSSAHRPTPPNTPSNVSPFHHSSNSSQNSWSWSASNVTPFVDSVGGDDSLDLDPYVDFDEQMQL